MQHYRHEDILQGYYPHSFTFNRDDVSELDDDGEYEDIPEDMCDPEKNGLFQKSRIYFDENQDQSRYKKESSPRGSPRKRVDWRSEPRQDDVRLRDRHYYKKKERKREEIPVWTLPPQ